MEGFQPIDEFETPFERKERISKLADEIIRLYDEAFYRQGNKLLEEIRGRDNPKT